MHQLIAPLAPWRYLFGLVELVALRRVAPRPAAQRFPANRAGRASRSAAARGGVVAARQPLPLIKYRQRNYGGHASRFTLYASATATFPPASVAGRHAARRSERSCPPSKARKPS